MKRSSGVQPEAYPDTMIRRVNWAKELDVVRPLFQGYRDWLAAHVVPATPPGSSPPVGLTQFDQVIAELPGKYGPPNGDVLLAFKSSDVVACGALRELVSDVGEIKRIYVRRDHMGPEFGPRLVRELLSRARELGFERVRVDALPTMEAAIQYYQELGFKPIRKYWEHPVDGSLFFEWSAK
jgi:putative acetyltransferase